MPEFNVFKEIPGGEKFHSCFLACYSLDCYFFEQRVVRTLRSKGIRNISVVTDAGIVEEYLKNMMGNVKKVSSLYSLTSVVAKGAFHPKLYMFFGDEAILMIIGSGNLTSGGMGKNHELFITFYADNEKLDQLPIIIQGWQYLQSITNSAVGITYQQKKWIKNYCSLINKISFPSKEQIKFSTLENDSEVAFIHNLDISLWDKLKQLIDSPSRVSNITIAAPYFDKNGFLIEKILKQFPSAVIDIFIQEFDVLLPIDIKKSARVKFYKWDETDQALKSEFKKFDRFQHGKLFHFQSGKTEYLLLGSPNATTPALLQTADEGNTETAILLKKVNAKWLSWLGVTGKKKVIDIKTLPPITTREAENRHTRRFQYKLKAIDRYSKEFWIYINQEIKQEVCLKLFDTSGDIVGIKPVPINSGLEWSIKLSEPGLAEQVVYGALYSKEEMQVSNCQIINNVAALETLHPSPENRRINKLIDRIIDGKYTELDLFDFYEAIGSERKKSKEGLNIKGTNSKNVTIKESAEISYEEAFQKSQKEQSHLGLEDFEPVRIWDTYFSRLEQELKIKEEEDIDDEEEGDLRSGKGREEKERGKKPFESKNVFEKAKNKVSRLFETYISGLIDSTLEATTKKGEYEISLTDYAFFLLATTHLIDIAGKEYSYKGNKGSIEKQVLLSYTGPLDDYCSFDSIAVDLLGKFLLFHHNAIKVKEYPDEYEKKKIELFRQMAWGKVLTIITVINTKCRIKEEKYWDKWCLTILLNACKILNPVNTSIKDIIRKEFNIMKIENIPIDLALQKITTLYREALSITRTTTIERIKKHFIFTVQLGYCYIEEALPHGDYARFYRVSNPGVEFADGDFIAEKLYSVERSAFLSSYKRLGEIYNKS